MRRRTAREKMVRGEENRGYMVVLGRTMMLKIAVMTSRRF